MWQVEDPQRFARAVRGASATFRLEVWSEGRMLAESAPFSDGEVTDEWVTAGVRRSLSLTLPPTRQWLRWLDLGNLEVRPFRGLRISRLRTAECPLGRFQVQDPPMSRPVERITIRETDYYGRVLNAPVPPRMSRRGLIADHIAWLLKPVMPKGVKAIVTAGALDWAPSVVIEGSLHEAIAAAAKSIDAEVYVDRLGVPTIADARVYGPATTEAVGGDSGTVVSLARTPDPAKTYNEVIVSTTSSDVRFPPRRASILNTFHPAHKSRIGPRQLAISSSLYRSADQAQRVAWAQLRRFSGSAETYTYQRLPDPTTDAGDSIRGALVSGGSRVMMVASISHPLTAGPLQTVTTVETQLAEQSTVMA